MTLSIPSIRKYAHEVADQLLKMDRHIEVDGDLYPIEKTSRAGLRNVKIDEYVFMEQNPEKDSRYAKMAREGHEIIWIFQDWEYVGRIIDGDVAIFTDKINKDKDKDKEKDKE